MGEVPLSSETEVGRDWYFIAEQLAPAPHLACPEGRAAPRIVLVTVPRVSRSCGHFPDGLDLHLPQWGCIHGGRVGGNNRLSHAVTGESDADLGLGFRVQGNRKSLP